MSTTGQLDVLMIVKDEEAFLPAALASLDCLAPLLGTVYVYDTGSQDQTVRIAREWGAVVTEGYWDADFARARNVDLRRSRATWGLQLDADERVVADAPRLAEHLRAAAGDPGLDAIQATMILKNPEGDDETNTIVRLFRPKRVSFRNRIHERLVRRDGSDPRLSVIEADVFRLDHYGYTPATMAQKVARNLDLLDLQVEDLRRPGQPTAQLLEALLNRGRTHAGANRWEEAERDFLEVRTLTGDPRFRLSAGEQLADLWLARGRAQDVVPLVADMAAEGLSAESLAWLRAQVALAEGRPQEALPLLRTVNRPTTVLGYGTSWAPVLRARLLAASQVGEYDEALAAAIPLMAKHGETAGLGRLCAVLWGTRPPQMLAQLLWECGTEHLDAMVAEFSSAGPPGESVAAALEGMGG